jgi:hypothetical protein
VSAIARRAWLAALAGLALGVAGLAGGAGAAAAQTPAADPAPAVAPAGAPEPLWVPDPEGADASAADADATAGAAATDADPLAEAAIDVAATAVTSPLGDVVGDDVRVAMAHWMARGMQDAGLPGELPVMASLVESGLRNLPYGDADSVGFFQMRQGIWDRGAYAGYLARPELQLRWFADHAIAVREARRAAGDLTYGEDPATWGEWIASIEQPAVQYRGRYQPRLAEAQALLATAAPPVAPFEVGLAVGAPVTPVDAPDAAAQAVLSDADITLSPVAREDLEANRVDARLSDVLVRAAQVSPIAISVFQTGHSYLTVNGSVSNHSFGRAADISTVGGEAVSPTNETAHTLALALSRLPAEIRPTEIGSPWAVDDPAYFTDGDHQDHLHVGFDTTAGDDVAASSSASPAGVVETVSLTPPKPAHVVAPTEPRFKAGAGGRDAAGSDPTEPRFSAGGSGGGG